MRNTTIIRSAPVLAPGSQVRKRRYRILGTVVENGRVLRLKIAASWIHVLRIDLFQIVRSYGVACDSKHSAIVVVVPSCRAARIDGDRTAIENVLLDIKCVVCAGTSIKSIL